MIDMADKFMMSAREIRQANARGAAALRNRVLRVSGQAVTIGEVERRTGLSGKALTDRLSRVRRKGAVTWEALA